MVLPILNGFLYLNKFKEILNLPFLVIVHRSFSLVICLLTGTAVGGGGCCRVCTRSWNIAWLFAKYLTNEWRSY